MAVDPDVLRRQLERFRSYPDIGHDDLIRYFTLAPADVAFIDPGRGRGPTDRLGLAVQLATLPWLGFVPDEVSSAPAVAVARLAERLGVVSTVLSRRPGAGPRPRWWSTSRSACAACRPSSSPNGCPPGCTFTWLAPPATRDRVDLAGSARSSAR
ncbi:DUF4158 domain-containing protein [Nonomuraea basaltis]|uniref:DUF4158 domain-containing protein n=1 Tax=Nonomuraea basaltis TaxID=2495887 RepID=UPI00197CC880